MPEILSEYLVLAWVLISVFGIGIAICHRWFSRRGMELLGYGALAGIVVHALVAILIRTNWKSRQVIASSIVLAVVTALIYLVRRGVFAELQKSLNRQAKLALAVWLAFLVSCVALVHVEVTWPANLPDGLYIFKDHRVPVKIQYLAGLPTDNYLPYVVEEFFVRHISFRSERPIIPGQEVSNRTILMALVAVPFRKLLNWNNPSSNELGRFSYVGTKWPDVERLNDDNSFNHFLPIGIFLNSLLLLGLLVVFSNLEPLASLVPATLFFATSPYCLIQTIFTWPKALGGFFLLLALNSIRRGHSAKVVGLCAALAYHSHPLAIAALVSLGAWYVWQLLRKQIGWRPLIEYTLVVIILILPWVFWTQLVLKIPSDLISQNFSAARGSASLSIPLDFIWVRAMNAFNTLSPTIFSVYPFQLGPVVNNSAVALPTAVGLVLIPFAVLEFFRRGLAEPAFIWVGLAVPAAMLLLVFSYPAVPLLHGWQALVGALIFLGALRLRRQFSKPVFIVLLTLQLACNLALVFMRATLLGVHW